MSTHPKLMISYGPVRGHKRYPILNGLITLPMPNRRNQHLFGCILTHVPEGFACGPFLALLRTSTGRGVSKLSHTH